MNPAQIAAVQGADLNTSADIVEGCRANLHLEIYSSRRLLLPGKTMSRKCPS